MEPDSSKPRLRAVSFLNTVPLVWGMQHGPERAEVDLSFSIPSDCARDVENGTVDAGLVPVAEVARQNLEMVPDVGIACYGAVRSILLFSRVPWTRIQTFAADVSSRTSVELARVILRERFGIEPKLTREQPRLADMLSHTDCALVIGDPALQIEPERSGFEWMDLGAEWLRLTGLPFVFAVWAGKPGIPMDDLSRITTASYRFGNAHLDEIVASEYARRSISRELARRYLTEHIRFEIGKEQQRGLDAFLEMANLRATALAGEK